jgi:hypothetical protein
MCLAVVVRIDPYDHARAPSHREIIVHAKASSASSHSAPVAGHPHAACSHDRGTLEYAPLHLADCVTLLRRRGSAIHVMLAGHGGFATRCLSTMLV